MSLLLHIFLSSLVKYQPKVQLSYERGGFGLGSDKSLTLASFSQQGERR